MSLKPGKKERRIRKELLTMDQFSGVRAKMRSVKNIYRWEGEVDGPPDTPYSGGTFKIDIVFPKNYPLAPPKCKFLTRIYHCNVNSSGSICLDILKTNWSPVLTIGKVLLSIQALMQDANEKDPLVGDIARLYKRDRKAHDNKAREWTRRYAMPTRKPT